MNVVGTDIPRVDGPAKVTGAAQYTANIELPGMVFVKVLRSIHPHAKILSLDTSRAERLAGVVAVLTRDDLTQLANPYFGAVVKDQPVLAIDKVRYIGDIVAAVAAEARDIAEEAVDLIQVEYEPLPPVFDPVEAMKADAPVIHPQRNRSGALPEKHGYRFEDSGNVVTTFHVADGDVDAGFRDADEIFEDTYTSPKTQHA